MKKNKNVIVPINRNNMFYSEESYNYELMMGKNYLEQDVNQTIVLYEVDLENTNMSDVYYEIPSNEVKFKTPKELHVIYSIENADLKSYNNKHGVGAYLKTGKLKFSVYQSTLDELDCDIKRGDYIGVPINSEHIEYFVIVDDGKVNFDNKHTMYGTIPFFRTCYAAPVDKNEFNGK